METLSQHIESLIFISDHAISFKEIKSCLEESLNCKIMTADLENTIDSLMEKYKSDAFAMEIIEISGGYKFMTKGTYHHTISTYLRQSTNKKLSQSALETLSIIAYKQPVIKSDMESIRGVSCDYAIQKLLEKDLVEIQGRSEGPGRPLLYGTSEKFMDYFGIKDISDLPRLKDFKTEENTVGEPAPLEDNFNEVIDLKDEEE